MRLHPASRDALRAKYVGWEFAVFDHKPPGYLIGQVISPWSTHIDKVYTARDVACEMANASARFSIKRRRVST